MCETNAIFLLTPSAAAWGRSWKRKEQLPEQMLGAQEEEAEDVDDENLPRKKKWKQQRQRCEEKRKRNWFSYYPAISRHAK